MEKYYLISLVMLIAVIAIVAQLEIQKLRNEVSKYEILITKYDEELRNVEQQIYEKEQMIMKLNAELESEKLTKQILLSKLSYQENFYAQFNPILEAAQKVARANNWTYNKYMCCDFAYDLVKELESRGYTAKVKTGYFYDKGNGTCSELNYERFKCKHCWVIVEVPIEAVTGQVIPIEEYKINYK